MHESAHLFIIFGVPFHVYTVFIYALLLPVLVLILWLAFMLGASLCLSKLAVLDLSQLIENSFSVPSRQMVR